MRGFITRAVAVAGVLLFVLLQVPPALLAAYPPGPPVRVPAEAAPPAAIPPGQPGQSLLVIAPHPDDETLAAGGLMARAVSRGDTVTVVVLTDGDGSLPTARLFGGATHNAFLAAGRTRREEVNSAVRRLGVAPSDLFTLGLPDGYLERLWHRHWSDVAPFSSPTTGLDRAPYGNRLPYSGSALFEVLLKLIVSRRPSAIYFPAYTDLHPDHSATYRFALAAVAASGRSPALFTYQIHGRGDDTGPWIDLTGEEMATKRAALAEHKTQMRVAGQLLTQFLRRTEKFGRGVWSGASKAEWVAGPAFLRSHIAGDRSLEVSFRPPEKGRTKNGQYAAVVHTFVMADQIGQGRRMGESGSGLFQVALRHGRGDEFSASVPLARLGLGRLDEVTSAVVVVSVEDPTNRTRQSSVVPTIAIRVR